MIILNFGVPRSGTVLVNAIIRTILMEYRHKLVVANCHAEELDDAIRHMQRTGVDRFGTALIHIHTYSRVADRLLARSPLVTGFANYRDPRDVCVSLMRLHDQDFETASASTVNSFQHLDLITASQDLMILPYEYLVADLPGHIFQIGRYLGLSLGMDQVDRIAQETSMDKHRSIMEKVQSKSLPSLRERQNRNRVLVEDTKTLINDRHIQSGASGRWRTELSDEDKAKAETVFAPLVQQYGYAT